MKARLLFVTAGSLVLGLSSIAAVNGQPAQRMPGTVHPGAPGQGANGIVTVYLTTTQTGPDGMPIAGVPSIHALLQLDCQQLRYRRLGADVEWVDSVSILSEKEAGHDWRSPVPGDPEALQLQARCKAAK